MPDRKERKFTDKIHQNFIMNFWCIKTMSSTLYKNIRLLQSWKKIKVDIFSFELKMWKLVEFKTFIPEIRIQFVRKFRNEILIFDAKLIFQVFFHTFLVWICLTSMIWKIEYFVVCLSKKILWFNKIGWGFGRQWKHILVRILLTCRQVAWKRAD